MKLTAWEQFPYPVRKAWRVMRITTFLILVLSLHLSAKTTAQKITLTSTNISIEQFFNQLEKQTGYSFLLESGVVSKDEKVSVNVKDVPLEIVLDQILKPIKLSFKIENKTVYIIKAPQVPLASLENDIPPIDIHGRVTDSLGNPLAGASVTVKGSKKGTSTDADGNFTLHGVNENTVLIISFTGFSSKSVRINGSDPVTVGLVHSNNPLDQVQIIAYGTTTQRMSTGDIGTVSSQVIEQQPVVNPLAALEGRVAGLYVAQGNGNPGSGFFPLIRGINSLSSGIGPLYVIDGVQYLSNNVLANTSLQSNVVINSDYVNPINFLNPLDIESITILKDADATAIYGSQGANGVILVTTKKGKSGKTKVDLNVFAGAGQIAHFMDVLNTPQYLEMRHEAFNNDGITPTLNNAPDLLSWDTTKNTNWQKKLIGGTENILNAQASFSGGSANTNFLISGNYYKQSTVFGSDFTDTRGSVNASFNHTSTDQKFKIGFSANYMSDNSTLPGADLTSIALTMPPDVPDLIDNKGTLIWPKFQNTNPYAYLLRKIMSNSSNLISSTNLSYQIGHGLTILSDFGYNTTLVNENAITPVSSLNPASATKTGTSIFNTSSIKSWIAQPQIKWDKQYGEGKLAILIGGTFQQSLSQGNTLGAYGYTNDQLISDMSAAGSVVPVQTAYSKYNYDAIFARISYSWDSKYLLNLNGRRDGSSRFGPDKQFSNFGAVGIGWIFSSETFVQNSLRFLSFGKLRASYGLTGNDQIADYGYLSLWTPTSYPYQNTPGLYPASLTNPDYSWERTRKLEIGIELGLFKDRIFTTVSWYQNRSDNQLLLYPLPPSTGFSYVQANLPALIQNRGLEIVLKTINIKTNYFQWTTSLNVSFPNNQLLAFPNLENSPYSTQYVIGQSVRTSRYLHSIGVDPKTGIQEFQDYNGNGMVDIPDDEQSLKMIGQKYFGGFDNTFSYKGFQLDIFFQFVEQNLYSSVTNSSWGVPGARRNQPLQLLNRWQKPGDDAAFQKFTTGSGNGADVYTAWTNGIYYGDGTVTNASFIRLKNVSISYSLPANIIHKMKVSDLKIYVQGQNLITFTKYIGMDPENGTINVTPPLRIITGGIKLSL